MRKITITTAALLLSLSVPLASSAGSIDPKSQKAIDGAIAAANKAAEVGFEWRDTGKMIKKAKAAAEKGDNATAMKMANRAADQGRLAYQQYLDQKNAGNQ